MKKLSARLKRPALLALILLIMLSLLAGCAEVIDTAVQVSGALSAAEETKLPVSTESSSSPEESAPPAIDEHGSYTSRDDVALYIHIFGYLPENFVTKDEARGEGWSGGSLEPYFPGCCIGGDRFGNYEGLLPEASGREYHECDIDTLGESSRGAKRIVFSNDGLIYYTEDHYESFTLLYGEE